jgi:hypothetical protein
MAFKETPRKAAGSTEVIYYPVRVRATDGSFGNPTAATVTVSSVRLSAQADAGTDREPTTAEYVAGGVTWATWTGPRYAVAINMGPAQASGLNPTGPTASEEEVEHEIWARLVSGGEDVRMPIGRVIIIP